MKSHLQFHKTLLLVTLAIGSADAATITITNSADTGAAQIKP
ncbi:MAG: hypothetical protein ABI651_07085 [Verrucomicrobiota bacterium]